MQNGLLFGTAGVTFGPIISNSSTSALLNGTGVSFAATGTNPDSPVAAVGSASGRANETGGPVYYSLIGSNGTSYSWGDARVTQEQTATLALSARNAAETNVTGSGFGNADGTNKSSTSLAVTVGNCPAGGCTISFSFQADPFISALVDAAAAGGSIARGTLAVSVTLTNVATNATVFTWTPDGSLGTGIFGGTESADAANLNLTLAALPGQTLTHSGPYGAGTFGNYAATTNALATGNYTLSLLMNEKTDVLRAIPEPETYAMLLAGLGLLGYMARRRKQEAA